MYLYKSKREAKFDFLPTKLPVIDICCVCPFLVSVKFFTLFWFRLLCNLSDYRRMIWLNPFPMQNDGFLANIRLYLSPVHSLARNMIIFKSSNLSDSIHPVQNFGFPSHKHKCFVHNSVRPLQIEALYNAFERQWAKFTSYVFWELLFFWILFIKS